ncbi:hypothetical protein LTR95_006842 [Oleoguttula sp. CCFEE 5521]
MNAAMMLNEAMFEGTGGWVLKPEGYRLENGTLPALERTDMDITISILAAQGLGIEESIPDAYLKCELHVGSQSDDGASDFRDGGKNKGGEWKRKTAVRHSRDPDFAGETLSFAGVTGVVPGLSFVRYVFSIPVSIVGVLRHVLRLCVRPAQSGLTLLDAAWSRHGRTLRQCGEYTPWDETHRHINLRLGARDHESLGQPARARLLLPVSEEHKTVARLVA